MGIKVTIGCIWHAKIITFINSFYNHSVGCPIYRGLNHQLGKKRRKTNQRLQSKNDTIQKQNEEKELLLKEIHHRVKNNLQVVSSLLELQAKKGDESAQTAFADGQSRVKAMALIHERLYRNEDIASIDFADYAGQLARQISALFPHKNAEIKVVGNGCQFDIDTAVPLGLIINELITNAFKYAFTENGGKLNITITQHGDEGYQLVVQDNGAGMPQDFSLKNSQKPGSAPGKPVKPTTLRQSRI